MDQSNKIESENHEYERNPEKDRVFKELFGTTEEEIMLENDVRVPENVLKGIEEYKSKIQYTEREKNVFTEIAIKGTIRRRRGYGSKAIGTFGEMRKDMMPRDRAPKPKPIKIQSYNRKRNIEMGKSIVKYYVNLLREECRDSKIELIETKSWPRIILTKGGVIYGVVSIKTGRERLTEDEKMIKLLLEEEGIHYFVYRGHSRFMENVIRVLEPRKCVKDGCGRFEEKYGKLFCKECRREYINRMNKIRDTPIHIDQVKEIK